MAKSLRTPGADELGEPHWCGIRVTWPVAARHGRLGGVDLRRRAQHPAGLGRACRHEREQVDNGVQVILDWLGASAAPG
jgi:hypothetical protein